MSTTALALACSIALVSIAPAQTRPDFSGTWQLDRARSDIAAWDEDLGPVTVAITQSAAGLDVARTTSRGSNRVTYIFATRDRLAEPGTPMARWEGDALVTTEIRDIRGQSVSVQQTRRLSRDGNEMVVESVVNVQHGYSAAGARTYSSSTDRFVRTSK